MAQFVRHHAGNLALGACRFNHAAVDVGRTARKSKRVDLARVHDLERVPELWMPQLHRDCRGESAAEPRNVGGQQIVVKNR